MTQLRTFNARGTMPESLSGAYYRLLDNGVPHQMFSELVAIPGLVDGVLGMDLDVPGRALHLTPHLPPAWPGVTVRKFPFGQGQLSLEFHQSPGRLTADLNTTGVPAFELEFSPALPAGATVVSATQQGKSVPFKTTDNGSDVHVQVKLSSITKATIEVRYRGGISVDVPWQPILEGDSSRNLRVLKTAYQNGQFQMLVEGRPELKYDIRLLTPWLVSAGGSAEDIGTDGDWRPLRVSAPATQEHPDKAGYVRWTVAVGLKPK
jgi:hypothetical protein